MPVALVGAASFEARKSSRLRMTSPELRVSIAPGWSSSVFWLCRLAGLVALDLCDITCNPALCFEHVESVLQTKEVAFGETKELAQAKIGVRGDVTRAVDDRVDAISRHTD